MTFSTPSLILSLKKTFCLISSVMLPLVLIVLLPIIILPCIVRILQQSVQKLSTELYLIILNKKGGYAGGQREELRPWQRS